MQIRELILTNFRGFDGNRSFPFAENFTVIAGINGRGKTSILDAIRFAAGRLIPQISRASGQYPKITKHDVNHRAENGTFEIELKCDCAGYPVAFKLEFNHSSNTITPTKLSRTLARTIRDAYGDDPNSDDDAAPLVVCYTTDRAAFRLPQRLPKQIPALQRAAFAGALANRTIDFKDLAFRLRALNTPDAIHDENTAGRLRNGFNKVVSTFLEGFEHLRVNEEPLGILVDKSGEKLDLLELSDGERSVLALAADLARRLILANPRLEDPLQGSGVVLIDELELHLHPKWQRTIVETLRRTYPNIQFISTTHSPYVIQTLRDGQLIVLSDELIGDYENRGLEEISTTVLNISDPEVSPRYAEMLDVARAYFAILESNRGRDATAIANARRQLDTLIRPHHDNPAFQAFLEAQARVQMPIDPHEDQP